MCGRYALFDIGTHFQTDHSLIDLIPNYNIAPSRQVNVIVNTAGKVTYDTFYWGFVPFWAKDKSIGSRMINARMETIY